MFGRKSDNSEPPHIPHTDPHVTILIEQSPPLPPEEGSGREADELERVKNYQIARKTYEKASQTLLFATRIEEDAKRHLANTKSQLRKVTT